MAEFRNRYEERLDSNPEEFSHAWLDATTTVCIHKDTGVVIFCSGPVNGLVPVQVENLIKELKKLPVWGELNRE